MMPLRLRAALLLLPLALMPLQGQAQDARHMSLSASKSELGLGGIRDWDFNVSMDALLHPGDKPNNAHPGYEPETTLNVDRFLLSGQTGDFRVRFGHHHATGNSLLFDQDTDWGVSATRELDALDSNLSMFAVSAGDLPDTAQEMRLADDPPYYTGGLWRSAVPLPGTNTTLWTGYVNGGNIMDRTHSLNGIQRSMQYKLGYSVGMSSHWLGDRLNLELEQATSRFSVQGNEQNYSDHAYLGSLHYQPPVELAYMDWEIGAETLDVGPAFYSPGNPTMARARAIREIFLTLRPFDAGSMGYTYREVETGHGSGTRRRNGNEIFADLNLSPWEWLSLQPYGEFERRHYEEIELTGHQSLFSLTADAWLIPEQLVYRNTVRLTRHYGPDPSTRMHDRRHQYLAGELQWQALSPTRNRSGLDVNLSFSADRHETRFNPGGGPDDYRVLLSISSGTDGNSRIW